MKRVQQILFLRDLQKKIAQTTLQPVVDPANSERGAGTVKKGRIVFGFLVALLMVAAVMACASTPEQSSTGEYIDDTVITTKVKTELANDNLLKSFQISVETRKGIVQLSGFVDSQYAVDQAGRIARGVEGVKSVENGLVAK